MNGILMLTGAGREASQVETTRKRHASDQAVRNLGRADRMLADGKDIAAVFCGLGVSEQNYYRWRN
jgi:putative transposase